MFRRLAFLGLLTALVAITTHVWAQEPRTMENWGTVTRAEAVKIIIEKYEPWKTKAEKIASHMPPLPLFWDTDQKAWYAPYLEVAFDQEIAMGFPDGSFRPGNALTQEQAALLITRGEDAKRGRFSGWEPSAQVIRRALEYGVRVAEPVQLGRTVSLEEFLWMFPENEYVPSTASRASSSSAMSVRSGSGSSRSGGIAPQPMARSSSSSAPRYNLFSRGSSSSSAPVAPQYDYQPEPEPAPEFLTPDDVPALQYASNQNFAIAMPTLGIVDLTITHPGDPYSDEGLISVLDRGVGHLFSYPGNGGKIFIYGHSSNWSWDTSGYAKIFRQINRLNVGDLVYVTYENKLHVYQVMEKGSVPAGDLGQFSDNGDGEELLLYTCWPPDSISERYVVRASPIQVIPF